MQTDSNIVITARVRSTTGGCFQYVHHRGGEVPHNGVPPSKSRSGWGTPLHLGPGQDGVTPSLDGEPPVGKGYPLAEMGYPLGKILPGWDVYPPAEMGYPRLGWGNYLLDRLYLDRLCRGRYSSCGFPQEDFLV